MNTIRRIIRDVPQHWVGDGFPVRSLISYAGGNAFDPFLLLDYAGPHSFPSAQSTRGVALSDGAGTVRVIAGEFEGTKGPARTFTAVNVWDVEIAASREAASREVELALPQGHTSLIAVQSGAVQINGTPVEAVELAELDRAGSVVRIETEASARLLVLTGEPIGEPVVGQGPFVMNTREEITRAIQDYQNGQMGRLS